MLSKKKINYYLICDINNCCLFRGFVVVLETPVMQVDLL